MAKRITFKVEVLVDDRGMRMGLGHIAPASVARWHDEALDEDAHREALAIAASIPVDGRPADVTELLTAAELLTDAREHLAALRHAVAVLDTRQAQIIAEAGDAAADIAAAFPMLNGGPGAVFA